MDPQFKNYCRTWSSDVAQILAPHQRIAYFQKQLPTFLLDHSTVRSVLEPIAYGKSWPDLRLAGFSNNEVLLYLDPGGRFSIRLYFHSPHTHTAIHDHNSWGVSGTPFGRLSVIRYTCQGGVQNEHASIRQERQDFFLPGEVNVTLPGDEGIHQTGSVDDTLNLMISAYGRPGRRLYVQRYDADSGKVERRYPPRIFRRMKAKEALKHFGYPPHRAQSPLRLR